MPWAGREVTPINDLTGCATQQQGYTLKAETLSSFYSKNYATVYSFLIKIMRRGITIDEKIMRQGIMWKDIL